MTIPEECKSYYLIGAVLGFFAGFFLGMAVYKIFAER